MGNSIKYDPLHIHNTANERSRAIDSLMSVKIETNLEYKLADLMKELITTEDKEKLVNLTTQINNVKKDIEDAKRTREINQKHFNEETFVWETMDVSI